MLMTVLNWCWLRRLPERGHRDGSDEAGDQRILNQVLPFAIRYQLRTRI